MHLKIRVNGHNEMRNPLKLLRITAILVMKGVKKKKKAAENIPMG